jgi:stage III sporulation protein AD
MDISKILFLGLISVVLVVLLKDEKPEISIQISLAAGIIIFMLMLSKLTTVINAMQLLAIKLNIDVIYLNIILKIIGISYLTSFGVELCKDSGQSSIGSKIELAGKIFIIVISIPILMAVMDLIMKLIP